MIEFLSTRPHKSLNVLLIGESCYDYYHYGEINRISPEAPIPIMDFKYVTKKLGMASNVADNLKALGVEVTCLTDFLENKRRYIDIKSGQQLLRVDERISDDWYNSTIEFNHRYDAIVISDYDKGFLPLRTIIDICANNPVPIFIDTKKPILNTFKHAFVKINEDEFNKAIALPVDRDNLIVTKGGNEVTWGDRVYTPPKVVTHDVCGAGDTFLASLVYKYLTSDGNRDASVNFAMKAAAVTVQNIGVYSPTLKEINR